MVVFCNCVGTFNWLATPTRGIRNSLAITVFIAFQASCIIEMLWQSLRLLIYHRAHLPPFALRGKQCFGKLSTSRRSTIKATPVTGLSPRKKLIELFQEEQAAAAYWPINKSDEGKEGSCPFPNYHIYSWTPRGIWAAWVLNKATERIKTQKESRYSDDELRLAGRWVRLSCDAKCQNLEFAKP